jgi:uncharacterized protein YqeY
MLIDDIKKRAVAAAKAGDTVTRDVLRFALGELQTAEATKNRALREEESAATLRKLIESNEETMRALVVAACAEPDPVVADLARTARDGDADSFVVLEDALRERGRDERIAVLRREIEILASLLPGPSLLSP